MQKHKYFHSYYIIFFTILPIKSIYLLTPFDKNKKTSKITL